MLKLLKIKITTFVFFALKSALESTTKDPLIKLRSSLSLSTLIYVVHSLYSRLLALGIL
jgi:hypothetical protein